MRKLIPLMAAAALFAAAAPTANAAKRIPYQGKASGGEKVTFQLAKNRMWNFVTGVPTTCLPIQGGGKPMTGMELWSFS